MQSCIICGSSVWAGLPSPNPKASLTTACTVVESPLGKAHCTSCGLVQKVYEQALGATEFYEKEYSGYYDRPGTAAYHDERYRLMVEWIQGALGGWAPGSVIDVGCGQGGAMRGLQAVYPRIPIVGLEPSTANAAHARSLGFQVYNQRLGAESRLGASFDLAVAIYVLQHVLDPVDFLKGVRNLLDEGGRAAVIVPNGDVPNIELLWSDQNFAFTAGNLFTLAERSGLVPVSLGKSPEGLSTSWLLLLEKGSQPFNAPPAATQTSSDQLLRERTAFLNGFIELDMFLCRETAGSTRVINFGASYWSSILAVYCPRYWERVAFCAVDGGGGTLLGKPVIDIAGIALGEGDALVPGLARGGQEALRRRFEGLSAKYVAWHERIGL
jgi:SAM-dependent methyltransferase